MAAAILAGLPTLRGGFLGGDDIQLVRDHVLVNRPSLSHAVQLFSMIHRDLYQPVALLSFSLDFWVVKMLGYPPAPGPNPPGVWVFHLTNILLHAAASWLVFVLVRRMTGQRLTAVITALIFALHPLSAETVSWLNGRMMLLSTVFLLSSVILFDRWRERADALSFCLAILCVALCMMSKVRVVLPLLLLAPQLVRRDRPPLRWWWGWTAAVIVTAVFAWVNVRASSGMLAGGAAQLGENRLARTLAALGWYISRVVVPIGLSPYHPALADLGWIDPRTLLGAAIVLAWAGALWVARRRRLVLVGSGWFLSAIAVTLPLIPSRNILVAQRYVYLPNIGLYLLIAALLVHFIRRFNLSARPRLALLMALTPAAAMLIGFWRTADHYRSDIHRAQRFAAVYPDESGALVRLGWAYFRENRFDQALKSAQAEIERHGDANAADALQLIGMVKLRQGDFAAAEASFREALAVDPDNGVAQARLADALAKMNRIAEALEAYQKCADLAPNYNPGRIRFAELLLESGNRDAARREYQAVLQNNPYDVVAILQLAQIEYDNGEYEHALSRLNQLLEWMPQNVAARVNAGLCYEALDRNREANDAYRAAIAVDPDAFVPVMRLANLLIAQNQRGEAQQVLMTYLQHRPMHVNALAMSCLNLTVMGRERDAANLLARASHASADSQQLRGWYAWVSCAAGKLEIASRQISDVGPKEDRPSIMTIVEAILSLYDRSPQRAVELTESLARSGVCSDPMMFQALTILLERYSAVREDDPWPYYLLAQASIARGEGQMAKLAAGAFKDRTNDPVLMKRIDALVGGADGSARNGATEKE